MKSDGWVIDKYKSRELVHGRVMVDDFSAKDFYEFVFRANRKKGLQMLLSVLHRLLPLN